MKKSLRHLIFSCLIALALAACAPKEEDKPEPPKPNITGTQLIANAGDRSVTLDWTMCADAETYNIYYIKDEEHRYSINNKPSTSTMLAGTKITGLISAPLVISNLENDVPYWFALTAVNKNGESVPSADIVTATPSDPPPPKAPENVRANAGDGKITVTWDPVPGADGYNLYEGVLDETLTWYWDEILDVDYSTSPCCSYTITGLDNSTSANQVRYGIVVTAFTDSPEMESSHSFAALASPSHTPPPPAPKIKSVTAGNGTITVGWYRAETATSYAIYIGTSKGVSNSMLRAEDFRSDYEPDAGDDGPYGVQASQGIENDKTYYIVVTAINANGESAPSSEYWVKPSATSPASGSIDTAPIYYYP